MSDSESLLHQHLGLEQSNRLKKLGALADEQSQHLYLVGGPVRDLLAGVSPEDIDLMLVGDAPSFATYLFSHWAAVFPEIDAPCDLQVFEKFLTAKLIFSRFIFGANETLDFATAREESYSHSGAQPQVSPSSLLTDLRRRDFSLNAMAIDLGPGSFGNLEDPMGGKVDLEQGMLRVLHKKSFVDDPARLLRAVRFSQRFNFSFATETSELFTAALDAGYLQRLPPFRFFDEMKKAFSEHEPHAVLQEFLRLGVLQQFYPGLTQIPSPEKIRTFLSQSGSDPDVIETGSEGGEADDLIEAEQWHGIMALLFAGRDERDFRTFLKRYRVTSKHKRLLLRLWGRVNMSSL